MAEATSYGNCWGAIRRDSSNSTRVTISLDTADGERIQCTYDYRRDWESVVLQRSAGDRSDLHFVPTRTRPTRNRPREESCCDTLASSQSVCS